MEHLQVKMLIRVPCPGTGSKLVESLLYVKSYKMTDLE
jgi:hypothetical protein